MYAHQVIDDFEKLKGAAPEMRQMMDLAVVNILKSQKFHLGDISTNHILATYTGERLFDDPEKKFVRFPYSHVWIDWMDNIGDPLIDYQTQKVFPKKQACLAMNIGEDITMVFLFNYLTMWVVIPTVFIIKYDESRGNFLSHVEPLPMLKNILSGETLSQHIEECSRELTVLNMFLELINCKNITSVDNSPPEKLNKKRRKNKKQELFSYKTLVIKQKTGRGSPGSQPKDLWENRVHMCRGHFKTFTEDKPLFGSVTGTYWWQPSVRGSSSKGIIQKDYLVEV